MQVYNYFNGDHPKNIPKPSAPIIKEAAKITWKTLLWFGFCCFCLGVALGCSLPTS